MPQSATRTNAGTGLRVVAPRDDSLDSPSQRVPQQAHAASVAGTNNTNMVTNLETLQRASSVRGRVVSRIYETCHPVCMNRVYAHV